MSRKFKSIVLLLSNIHLSSDLIKLTDETALSHASSTILALSHASTCLRSIPLQILFLSISYTLLCRGHHTMMTMRTVQIFDGDNRGCCLGYSIKALIKKIEKIL